MLALIRLDLEGLFLVDRFIDMCRTTMYEASIFVDELLPEHLMSSCSVSLATAVIFLSFVAKWFSPRSMLCST